MQPEKRLTRLALAALLCGGLLPEVRGQSGWASITTPELSVVVADNSQISDAPWLAPGLPHPHAAGMNGLAFLGQEDSGDVLVGWLSGLNYEHIFSGDELSFPITRFAPRRAALRLVPVQPGLRVDLWQEGALGWPLDTIISFERRAPEAVDFLIACLPTQDVWSKHGYIGVFFASYIESPGDLGIHFLGRSRPGQGSPTLRWIHHTPPAHGEEASTRPAGGSWDPTFDPGFPLTLVSSFSSYEYAYPFFYGVAGTKVLIYMFATAPTGELRFAQSPSGGGTGNPAWDFAYFERDYHVGVPFVIRGRVVCKDFVDQEDVIRHYEDWSGQSVIRP